MALYPNTSTKQIINTEIKKKINSLDNRIETVNGIAEQAQSTANSASNSVSDLATVVDGKQTQIDAINDTLDTVQSTLSGKQDTLTFDNEPLTNSDNPVKSSGIYNALETKLDKESVKFNPEPNGTDALSTGGAYDIVQDLTEQLNDYKRNIVVQTTDADGVKKNHGAIIIDNQNVSETDKAIVVENGGTELKDTNVDGDLTSTTLAVANDATIGGNATVNGSVTSNEFIGATEKSISITDENNTTHTFNNTDNVSVSGVLKAQKDINGDSIDSTYVKNATKGVANGIATLDENGRLPYSQLPESAMELKGLWDASTNTPTLVQGVGTNGDFYIVSIGGTQFGESFNPNDRIIFVGDDEQWHRLPYTITSPVSSVNGKIGAVTLYGTDIQKSDLDSETITHALDNILNKVYPIGSLYWSSQSTDPSTLFGGTWVQIKDRFVWAKGDSDTVNATGGAKTVTLTVANLPSHNHTFTGSSVTTSANNRGHIHNIAHTHGYVPSGKIASTSGGTDNKVASEGAHTHNMQHYHGRGTMDITGTLGISRCMNPDTTAGAFTATLNNTGVAGSGSAGNQPYKFTFKASNSWSGKTSGSLANNTTGDTTDKTSTGTGTSHTHSAYFTGTIGTTTSQSTESSYGESQNHTHTVTAEGTIGNTGSGTAVDKMPPYVVKYCWERTA